jgi:hypothetical protein
MSAETVQLVAEEVAEPRRDRVPEKGKAKPKPEKLRAVSKSGTRVSGETVETETTATSRARCQCYKTVDKLLNSLRKF